MGERFGVTRRATGGCDETQLNMGSVICRVNLGTGLLMVDDRLARNITVLFSITHRTPQATTLHFEPHKDGLFHQQAITEISLGGVS